MEKKNYIEEWERRKSEAGSENRAIVKSLRRKRGKALDKKADEAHAEVFSQIDCLDCAGCCAGIPPIVNKTDTARISKKFGMKPADFEAQYLIQDEDGDTVMNTSPCPFLLADNKCMIYDIRPKACRQFPHTDVMSFSRNIKLHVMNATICPGVYHILRKLNEVI